MDILYSKFEGLFEEVMERLPELMFALLTLIVFHFLARGAKRVYQKVLDRSPINSSNVQFFGKLIYGFVFIIGILIALNIIGLYGVAASILASGGITAVILGFAFKDIGENFLAGFFMAFSRPFTNGDLIETEGIMGRVKNIELRHTHIRTANGCDVFVPSSQLLAKPLFNYTRDGLRRGSFVIGIDYRDDAQNACKILLDMLKQEQKLTVNPSPNVLITGFTPSYIELTVYFWIKVDVKRQEVLLSNLKSQLMDRARTTLIKHNFTLSSEVSTAVDMNELDVYLQNRATDNK
ncbi:mechanosensitive ion channel family protein [Fodinibius sp. Rm-B-1B1-1]|uniref:mechanosensitive ion channel family protein n=1 Tax=Fodinibius alkaliphilus TaxID=3140241 RepID=UPI00315AF5A3